MVKKMDFFTQKTENSSSAPLAYRMRPLSLGEYVGQKHILSEGKLLWRAIEADRISSLVLYGPPGTGKTALAFVISRKTQARFEPLNAVSCGVDVLRKIIKASSERKKISSRKTILFIDEIHRFSKNQQEVLMPAVEEGTVTLIGATIFNPFHSLVPSLLSRSLIFELKKLSPPEIKEILKRALNDKERGLGNLSLEVTEDALDVLAVLCDGDARKALTSLEIACLTTSADSREFIVVNKEVALESIQKKMIQYDRAADGHYDTISAFIKSLRGSDPDAAIYWLSKMLYAGEDPLFIARRMIIFASEDIGNADPMALLVADACYRAVEVVGLPEASINLAQATCYLASAVKDNASYAALNEATEDLKKERTQDVPSHLRSTGPAAGKGYVNPHVSPHKKQVYLEKHKRYYRPKKKV